MTRLNFRKAVAAAAVTATPLILLADDDHSRPTTVAANYAEHEHDGDHDHAEEAHADEVKLTAEAIKANGIRVETANPVSLAPTLEVPARVAFNDEAIAHVGSPVTGRAVEIKATLGATVKKNDDLLVVESPELGEAQSDLIQKRTALTVARSATQPAKESLDRARALYAQNEGIALAEVQRRQADLTAAEGAMQTAQAAAVAAENKLHLLGMDRRAISTLLDSGEIAPRFVLRAPIDGTVIKREITQGELVGPDKDALFIVADTSTLWVWADVPEAKLASVRTGAKATVHTAGSTKAVEGSVTLVAPQISEDTRTGRVRVAVANRDDARLRPGMFARVEIATAAEGDAAETVLAVPESAVQTVEGKPAVFVPVEGEANTFAKREVRVGPAVGGMVPILSGLKSGERYVAEGSFVLKADLGKAGAAHEH